LAATVKPLALIWKLAQMNFFDLAGLN